MPDRTLRLPRSVEGRALGVRAAEDQVDGEERASALTLAPVGDDSVRISHVRELRYSYLLQWAIVGCCLGTLILVIVYWLGGGHS